MDCNVKYIKKIKQLEKDLTIF